MIVAIAKPTPMQSTNTTQTKNFIKPRKCRPRTTPNPIEETESKSIIKRPDFPTAL